MAVSHVGRTRGHQASICLGTVGKQVSVQGQQLGGNEGMQERDEPPGLHAAGLSDLTGRQRPVLERGKEIQLHRSEGRKGGIDGRGEFFQEIGLQIRSLIHCDIPLPSRWWPGRRTFPVLKTTDFRSQ